MCIAFLKRALFTARRDLPRARPLNPEYVKPRPAPALPDVPYLTHEMVRERNPDLAIIHTSKDKRAMAGQPQGGHVGP